MTSDDLLSALQTDSTLTDTLFKGYIDPGDTVTIGTGTNPPDYWVSTPMDVEYQTLLNRLNGSPAPDLTTVGHGTLTVNGEKVTYWGPYLYIVIFKCDNDEILNVRWYNP